VAIAAYTSTKPAILRSFARNEHISDVAARGQAQNMVVDQLAIATAVGMTWAIRHNPRWKMLLPLVPPHLSHL
jgi:Vitamin B6 photo-protection and homoeostasis